MSFHRTKQAVFILIAAGCCFGVSLSLNASDMPNLLLVTIDTLRPDRLSCYGSPYVKTPNLDAVASRGALFTRAFAHNPMTLPSHVNIMLGLTALYHGVHENANSRVRPELLTLAEHLKSAGYATAAFIGAFPLDSRFGLNQGFDVYDESYPSKPGSDFAYAERSADKVVAKALTWLEGRPSPWFAWVHVWDPHAPYFPPEPYFSKYRTDPYSGEVAFTDAELGKLFNAVSGKGETLIVVTGDHGESLGEHGEMAHGYFAYNSTLWVPLFLSGPGVKPAKLEDTVCHIDLFPTICDLLGVKAPIPLQGISLLPLLKGKKLGPRDIYFESLEPYLHRGWAPLRGLIEGDKKYFDSPIPEFYDLAKDFAEAANLAPKMSVKDYQAKLRKIEKDLSSDLKPGPGQKPDRETMEKLRSLGYVVYPGARVKEKYGPEDDLKTLHPYERKFDRSLVLQGEGKMEESLKLLREIIAERKDFGKAYSWMSSIYMTQGRAAEAVKILEEGYTNNPSNLHVTTEYGLVLARVGQVDKAVEILQKSLSVYDENPEVWNQLGICFWRKGELDKALEYCRRALGLDQTDALIYNNLGTIYLSMYLKDKIQESLSKALEAYQKAVELDPDLAAAHNGLGGAFKMSGRVDEAVASWEKALQLDPALEFALYNLGLTHLQQGRKDKALECLEKYLALSKNSLSPEERKEVESLIQKCKEKRP